MPDGAQEKALVGLARSIGALFAAEEAPPPSAPVETPEVAVSRAAESAAELTRRLVVELGRARDAEERRRLVEAVARLGPPAAAELSDQLAETQDRAARRAYLDALVALGADGLPFADRMLADDRWWVVRNGAAVVAGIGGAGATERLVPALGHPEGKVRREAVAAVARLGGADAERLVAGMLEDPDPGVRRAAAGAVADLEAHRAHRSLVAMLEREHDADLLVAVLHALGRLGDPGAVPAIERHAVGGFLRRPSVEVRIAAYRALHQIGTPHARRLLNRAVHDRDATVKHAVRQVLGMT